MYPAQGYKVTWEGKHPPLERAVGIAVSSGGRPGFHQSKKVKGPLREEFEDGGDFADDSGFQGIEGKGFQRRGAVEGALRFGLVESHMEVRVQLLGGDLGVLGFLR